MRGIRGTRLVFAMLIVPRAGIGGDSLSDEVLNSTGMGKVGARCSGEPHFQQRRVLATFTESTSAMWIF